MKQKMKNFIMKATNTLALASATMYIGAAQVHAATSVNANLDMDVLTGSILDFLFKIFRVVGAVMIIFGISKFAMAINNERPEDIKGGITMALIGIVFVALPTVLKGLGVISF